MGHRFAVLALLLAASLAAPQVSVVAPGAQPPSTRGSDASYGPPRFADIETINFAIDGYQRTQVLTEGLVDNLVSGQYWTVRQGGSSLLLIAGRGLDPSALDRAISTGARMEVRGVVRKIRKKEYVKGVDLDLIEDPSLPPMPAPAFDQGWPRISITALAIRERVGSDGGRREGAAPGIARQVIEGGSLYAGKKIRIVGQFRGRNLFKVLQETSASGKEDWVLKDGETALWVTGKPPKGQGWAFDPTYKGDMGKWVEVEGKPELVNGILYFRASLVIPAKAPVVEVEKDDDGFSGLGSSPLDSSSSSNIARGDFAGKEQAGRLAFLRLAHGLLKHLDTGDPTLDLVGLCGTEADLVTDRDPSLGDLAGHHRSPAGDGEGILDEEFKPRADRWGIGRSQ